MNSISEVFRELDFDDASTARQQRDQRLTELQAQGMVCVGENLYHVEGWRVFTLVATPPARQISQPGSASVRASRRASSLRSAAGEENKTQRKERPQPRSSSSPEPQLDSGETRRLPSPKRSYEVR
jgi:hypothetical protein